MSQLILSFVGWVPIYFPPLLQSILFSKLRSQPSFLLLVHLLKDLLGGFTGPNAMSIKDVSTIAAISQTTRSGRWHTSVNHNKWPPTWKRRPGFCLLFDEQSSQKMEKRALQLFDSLLPHFKPCVLWCSYLVAKNTLLLLFHEIWSLFPRWQ